MDMSLLAMQTATVKNGEIRIPVRRLEHLKDGSKVAVLAFENHIEVMSFDDLEDRMFCARASEYVLAREWNTPEEDEAWKDL